MNHDYCSCDRRDSRSGQSHCLQAHRSRLAGGDCRPRRPEGGPRSGPFPADDVRRLAAEVKACYPDLTLLVNNAGVSKGSRVVTPDGLETTFATNHLGPFLLTNLLLPRKVINIASEQHRFVRTTP